MTCGGCEKAVRAVLSKTEGVTGVDVDLASKKVVVTGNSVSGSASRARNGEALFFFAPFLTLFARGRNGVQGVAVGKTGQNGQGYDVYWIKKKVSLFAHLAFFV